MSDYTRLWGLDAATRVSLSMGISVEEFAAKARELLAITGDGPLRKLAGLPVADATFEDISPADDGWSNLGDTPTTAATDWVPEPEPVPVVVERPDDEKDDDAEQAEEVEAEVVDAAMVRLRPPRMSPPRSVPAGEVISPDGIPWDRGGIARTLGHGWGRQW